MVFYNRGSIVASGGTTFFVIQPYSNITFAKMPYRYTTLQR